MTNENAVAWLKETLKQTDFMYEQMETAVEIAIHTLESIEQTGHWIRVKDKTEHWVWKCDKCGWEQRFDTNYCPVCGARMVEPQESEVQE